MAIKWEGEKAAGNSRDTDPKKNLKPVPRQAFTDTLSVKHKDEVWKQW